MHPMKHQRPTLQQGFTLIELMVVIAVIAIGTAVASLALRDGEASALAREGDRLTALLESARAQSRAAGVPVVWRATPDGFAWQGLPPGAPALALPQRELCVDIGRCQPPAVDKRYIAIPLRHRGPAPAGRQCRSRAWGPAADSLCGRGQTYKTKCNINHL